MRYNNSKNIIKPKRLQSAFYKNLYSHKKMTS